MNRRRALIGSLWASCAGLVAPKLAAQTPQKNADSDLEPVGKLKTVPTQDKRPARPKSDGDAAEPSEGAAVAGFDEADPATWGAPARNAPCPCGSGEKFKYCHGRMA